MVYDVIIVGGAAAGLTAAIYTARRAMKTLVITQDIGGQAATTPDVENYPGFELIGGPELMQKFYKQAEKSGAEFVIEEVKEVKKEGNIFKVINNTKTYETRAVILAFGLTHRHLGVPGEEELIGKGVSYCATCDAPLYKNKDVAVVGGGNSALDAAELLSKMAKKVYLIHRRDEWRGEQILVNRVKEAKNIEILYDSKVIEVKGEQFVNSIIVANVKDEQQKKEIPLNGIFIEIGFKVKADLIKDLIKLDNNNQIIITTDNETSTPGVLAAGDVTNISYKQIITSAGEGAKAALQAYKYLNAGKSSAVGIDWGKKKV